MNLKKIIIVIFFTFFYSIVATFAQGTIKGKILDEKGEAIVAASISLESNSNIGTYSNVDGTYDLEIPSASTQKIIVTYLGYKTIEETVFLKKNQILTKNFSLSPSNVGLTKVVVTAKANLSNDMSLEKMKMKSVANIDYISAATISKTGDASVISAVSRVSGVSTNGGFISIRGIGDRYIKTAINGMRIPTLDPFTNNIKLDIFPTSLINNVIITKTASPDLPGDWAGAFLSIETKDYPNKLTAQIETSFGYNSQSSFKQVLSSKRSSTDWLGYDNGSRDYNHDSFSNTNLSTSSYNEFAAAGLTDFFDKLGITNNTTWNETYTKLALVELGFLEKGLINDVDAVALAKSNYNKSEIKKQAYQTLNKNGVASAHAFAKNWDTELRKAPLDYSQTLSIGNQTSLFKKPLGYLFAVRYYSSIKYDSLSVNNKIGVDADGKFFIRAANKQETAIESNGWSSLFILAYALNRNNSFNIMIMPNINGINKIRKAVDDGYSQTYDYTYYNYIFYEERKQIVYQLKTSHKFPEIEADLKSKFSYTLGNSNAPDFKYLHFYSYNDTLNIIDEKESTIARYYRYLNENIFDSNIEMEMPLTKKKDLPRKIKFGGGLQHVARTSKQNSYRVNLEQSEIFNNAESFNTIFRDDEFSINETEESSSINKSYQTSYNPADNFIGNNIIISGFSMIDYSITSNILFSGGVRVEHCKIFADASLYNSLNLDANDERRKSSSNLLAIKPVNFNELSILPSINIIYKLKEDIFAPTNLRFNISKTVARPSIRELSDVIMYDYELKENVFGNSKLQMVQINNFDFRIESSFKKGDNVSFSLFYKQFKNHIELINSPYGFTWDNVDKSMVQGLEFEGKKVLNKHWEARANFTLVNSETSLVMKSLNIENGIRKYTPYDTITRAMFGQAPYVINGMITYTNDTLGLAITASYNLQGPKLVISSTQGIPDIYELSRNVIDLKLSKKIGSHFNMSVKISDLLNSPIRRSYKYTEGWIVDYDYFRYGTSYSFSISYKL